MAIVPHRTGSGRFIGVVGPSGAGKDSLIDAARTHFGEDGPVRFVQRVITRPAEAGGEEHKAVDRRTFDAMAEAGAFALNWQAHGLCYGIPADVRDSLASGRTVLANVSRGVIETLRASFPCRRVIVVTASPAVLAHRLAMRGRETETGIAARLGRAPMAQPTGPDVVVVANDGALEAAIRDFVLAIQVP